MTSVPKAVSRQHSDARPSFVALIEKYGIVALILASSLLYLWNLPINGWGNPYYAAAAQSGAASNEGLFFGSSDLANALSVDKPPLHTALLSTAVRIFGLSSWTVLVPNALLGVASIWLIYATVRDFFSIRVALLSGFLFVLTPVALLMFRFNNPDSTMLFIWCLAAFLATRITRNPTYGAYALLGLVIALGFLTKQFQALILVPALLAAVTSRQNATKLLYWRQLGVASIACSTTVATWLMAVELTSPSQRPWVGGSNTNSAIELTLGYNGLGRLTGLTSMGAINPKGYDGVVGVDAGLLRLFSPNFAGELSWFLLPAVLGFGLIVHRLLTNELDAGQRPLAKLMVAWFVSAFAVVSFMTGNVHPYYTLMLVPPICFLSAVAIHHLFSGIANKSGRQLAALAIAASAFMNWVFLSRYQDLGPVPSATLIISATLASVMLTTTVRIRGSGICAASMSSVALLAIPLLFNYVTLTTPQQGSFPQAGPVPTIDTWHRRNAEQLKLGQRETFALSRGEPVVPSVAELITTVPQTVSWPAMTVGSENAALYQLHTGRAVVAIGGFSGSDEFPSYESFMNVIRNGDAGYYIHQPGILKWGPSSDNTENIVHWIIDNCHTLSTGHLNVYDLRACR